MAEQLPQDILNARAAAESATKLAGDFTAFLPTVGDELKKRVGALFDENKDILGTYATSVGNLIGAPKQANDMFGGVRDPFSRQGLIADYVGQSSVAPITYAGLLGQRMGRIGDIVQAGTGAFQAQTQAQMNAAELAQKRADQLFQDWQVLKQIELEKQKMAQANAQAQAFKDFLNQQNAGGGGKGGTDFGAAIEAFGKVGNKDIHVDANEQALAYNYLRDTFKMSPAAAQTLVNAAIAAKAGGYQAYTAPSSKKSPLQAMTPAMGYGGSFSSPASSMFGGGGGISVNSLKGDPSKINLSGFGF